MTLGNLSSCNELESTKIHVHIQKYKYAIKEKINKEYYRSIIIVIWRK